MPRLFNYKRANILAPRSSPCIDEEHISRGASVYGAVGNPHFGAVDLEGGPVRGYDSFC